MAKADLRAQQLAFARHLRDPERYAAPAGIEDRRMRIYRELFFNNVQSLLAGTFPVLHRILESERWSALVRAFYHDHVSHTPLFMEVPQEFLAWLTDELEDDGTWPAFMRELAHYEWLELDVSVAVDEIDSPDIDPEGNVIDGVPMLSPVSRVHAYLYPVHRIGPGFLPDAPGDAPTFLVVYRKRDDSVGFTEINAVTARLLELVREDAGKTGKELLEQLAGELQLDVDTVVKGGRDILEDLKNQHIVAGTRR